MKHLQSIYICLVALFLIASRLWKVSLFPPALTHDEIVYAAQAKSLAVQGTYLNQQDGWLSLQPAHPMYAELPAKLMAPFFLIFHNPLLATRAFTIFTGITFPFILAWLSFGIWKNKKLSLIVLGVAAVNPLLWQMSRLAYDAVYSTYFYLLAGALFFQLRGVKTLFSFIPMALGFFCYQGYKLIFIPWLLFLLVVYFVKHKASELREFHLITAMAGVVLFVVYVFLLLPNQHVADRWRQTIFADTEFQSSTTNDNRRLALDSKLTPFISNKYTAIAGYITKRFVGAYSLEMLFLNGEPAQSAFAVWGHGWFYVIDVVFIVIGLVVLLHKRKEKIITLSLLALMMISTLPSTINSGESWYLLRMFFPYVMLVVILAWGIYALDKNRYFWIGFVPIYIIFVSGFGYYFYVRYPVLGANISYLSERVAINYIDRVEQENPNKRVYFYTIDPPVMFWNYLVYSPTIFQKNTAIQIAQAEKSGDFTLGKVTFVNACPDLTRTDAVIISEQWRTPCEQSQSLLVGAEAAKYESVITSQKSAAITIPSIVDNGAYFRIFGNPLCDQKSLPHYVGIRNLRDFSLNQQSDDLFCKLWFSNVAISD